MGHSRDLFSSQGSSVVSIDMDSSITSHDGFIKNELGVYGFFVGYPIGEASHQVHGSDPLVPQASILERMAQSHVKEPVGIKER